MLARARRNDRIVTHVLRVCWHLGEAQGATCWQTELRPSGELVEWAASLTRRRNVRRRPIPRAIHQTTRRGRDGPLALASPVHAVNTRPKSKNVERASDAAFAGLGTVGSVRPAPTQIPASTGHLLRAVAMTGCSSPSMTLRRYPQRVGAPGSGRAHRPGHDSTVGASRTPGNRRPPRGGTRIRPHNRRGTGTHQ